MKTLEDSRSKTDNDNGVKRQPRNKGPGVYNNNIREKNDLF